VRGGCAPTVSGAARRIAAAPVRNARRCMGHPGPTSLSGCQESPDLVVPGQ
jgi:hypothetical protein